MALPDVEDRHSSGIRRDIKFLPRDAWALCELPELSYAIIGCGCLHEIINHFTGNSEAMPPLLVISPGLLQQRKNKQGQLTTEGALTTFRLTPQNMGAPA